MSTAVVIGAGVIGLSAANVLRERFDVIIIEKDKHIGTGISSRNSEVIHAGIYYPPYSLKSRLCINGRRKLYNYLKRHSLDFIQIGKYIVSTSEETDSDIDKLYENAKESGLKGIEYIEPKILVDEGIKCRKALFSRETGIFSAHQFMNSLMHSVKQNADIILGAEVKHIERNRNSFILHVLDTDGSITEIDTDIVINAAGLGAAHLSAKMGYPHRVHLCKGDYFSLSTPKPKMLNHLVYPVPEKEGTGLGIHLTIDIGGRMKLGPDTEYIEKERYSIDNIKKNDFFRSVHAYLPWIMEHDIEPDMAGIRPKLQGPNDKFCDFIIENRDNFINLIGIESPGLTASLAIAEYIDKLI